MQCLVTLVTFRSMVELWLLEEQFPLVNIYEIDGYKDVKKVDKGYNRLCLWVGSFLMAI